MRRYLGLGVAWLGATVLSVLIASTAVAGIRDRVVETPVAVGPPTTTTTLAPATTTPTTLASTTTSMLAPTTTTETTAPPQTTTTIESATTTTAPPETTGTTPTTTTATTTTTTTGPPSFSYPIYALKGGTVTLEVGDGTVRVYSAVPNAGYAYHNEKDGPTEVEVEFDSNDHKSTLTAHFEGGELKVVQNEGRDGGDDGHGDD
ncbi:MAG: hypothetical protein WBV06_11100 [Acidimicrobiia bacterium]